MRICAAALIASAAHGSISWHNARYQHQRRSLSEIVIGGVWQWQQCKWRRRISGGKISVRARHGGISESAKYLA